MFHRVIFANDFVPYNIRIEFYPPKDSEASSHADHDMMTYKGIDY